MTIKEDYRLNGYHRKETFDTNGDFTTIEFFKNYTDSVFSDLRVRETRTYLRDVSTGLMIKRTILIEWFSGNRVATTKTLIKHYETPQKGHNANVKGRKNLTGDASLYLFNQIGIVNTRAFWKLVKNETQDFEETGDLSLITAINNSAEPYLTPTIKATMVAILNILY